MFDLVRPSTRPRILVVTSDTARAAALSLAASRATDADGEILVRMTAAAAIEAGSAGVEACVFDLSDPTRLDLEACLAVIRALGGRRVVVVATEEQTPLAAEAVRAGAFEFQPLGVDSPRELERALQRALDQSPGADDETAAAPDVARIAHDLNNVLGGILGLVDLVGRDRSLSAAGRTRIADLRHTAKRGAELVAMLLEDRPRRSESEPGAGTTFEILLQRANETPGPDSTPDPKDAETPRGTVLLVEDNEVLRATYEELLAGHGLRVLVAGDGFNALLQASTHPGRIDLLVSDVILPQMSGIELWRKLSRYRPEAQVLFISGNVSQARVMIGQGGGPHHLLAKPFDATSLLATVRMLLANSPFVRPEGPAPA